MWAARDTHVESLTYRAFAAHPDCASSERTVQPKGLGAPSRRGARAYVRGTTLAAGTRGALGFPDACPARISIGVEPLAHRFADAGLTLSSDAIYLAARAEAIPLISGTVDVVTARNSLDHVDEPRAVIAEARCLLRPGGTLILSFPVDHTPTPSEPHALDAEQVRSWLHPMTTVFEDAWAHPHGHDGHAVVLVATQP
jgi:SAM-dependent methyltransferase